MKTQPLAQTPVSALYLQQESVELNFKKFGAQDIVAPVFYYDL